jgi:integrase/recombinase XerD
VKNNLKPSYSTIFKDYLAYQKRRVSEQGYISLKSITRLVISWFQKEHITLKKTTVQDIVRYKQYLSEKVQENGTPLTIGSICNYLKAGKRLFKYLVRQELRKSNPFEEVPLPRLPVHLSRNVLTESQMSLLLKKLIAFDTRKTKQERLERYRTHIVAELLYSTGLRIAEASALVPADIDITKRKVYVTKGKGGKNRIAFLTSYAADILKLYLKQGRGFINHHWRKNRNLLFGTDRATLASAVNNHLGIVCSELGIPVITSHGFRHSLGTHLLRAGCDIRHIQIILGHESLNSTQIYTKVDKEDLRNSIDLYHPRHLTAAAV